MDSIAPRCFEAGLDKEIYSGCQRLRSSDIDSAKYGEAGSWLFPAAKANGSIYPSYSMFVSRGDLVHAGAAYHGSEPNVRCHVHLTSAKDKNLNSVETRHLEISLKLLLQ
jgi:hypothetical protein